LTILQNAQLASYSDGMGVPPAAPRAVVVDWATDGAAKDEDEEAGRADVAAVERSAVGWAATAAEPLPFEAEDDASAQEGWICRPTCAWTWYEVMAEWR
jgi:hypothetical protein